MSRQPGEQSPAVQFTELEPKLFSFTQIVYETRPFIQMGWIHPDNAPFAFKSNGTSIKVSVATWIMWNYVSQINLIMMIPEPVRKKLK